MMNLDPEETTPRRKQRLGLLIISILVGAMPLGGSISIAFAGLTASAREGSNVPGHIILFCLWLLGTTLLTLAAVLTGYFRRDRMIQVTGFFLGLSLWPIFIVSSYILVGFTQTLGMMTK